VTPSSPAEKKSGHQLTRDPLTIILNDDPAPKAGKKEESKDTLGADQEKDGSGIPIKKEDNQKGQDATSSKLDLAYYQKEALITTVKRQRT
jgi:hypothetical protein